MKQKLSGNRENNLSVSEIECKSILNKSALSDYALNCYVGCQHGCVYCYARFMTKFKKHADSWGKFVDVKINAHDVLKKQLRNAKRGTVFISSVCDGWQPVEAKYELTKKCSKLLLDNGFSINILTKSHLVKRDLQIIAVHGDSVNFGVTVTTMNEDLRKIIEPVASSSEDRLKLLDDARKKGINTYAFLGPFMPYITDSEENINLLIEEIKRIKVNYFYVDRLNPRPMVWPSLIDFLRKNYPDMISIYQKILFNSIYRKKYGRLLKIRVFKIALRHSMEDKLIFCF